MTDTLLHSAEPLAAAYDLGLMDLDGVMYEGKRPIRHAATGAASAQQLGLRLAYLTNNSSRTPETVADQLTGLGIPAQPEEIYSSAMAAVELAIQRHGPGALVLVVGGEGLQQAVDQGGLRSAESADDRPAAVLQGFRPTIGWADLSEAALAIRHGADYIATNLDSTLPTERGVVIGNGSLVAAVVNATGKIPVSAGKPEPEIFRLATQRFDGRRPLAVGDRLNTDIAGANASNIPSLHVLTGISSAREVILASPSERPSYLGLDLRDLSRPHPAVTFAGGWAACGTARATFRAGLPVLARADGEFPISDGAALTLDEYRAVAVAAWNGQVSEMPEIQVMEP